MKIRYCLYIAGAILLFNCSSAIRSTKPIEPEIGRHIDALLNKPEFKGASWGIVIQSLKTGETLFEHNPDKLFMPASNTKLFTTATALKILGNNYRHKTIILTNGCIEADMLNGDVIVQGYGDPALDSFSTHSIFQQFLDSLKSKGIKQINGRIIADDNYFDDVALGAAWSWDNLSSGYSAQISALSINKNAVELTIAPSDTIGRPAIISAHPNTNYITIINNVITDSTEKDISIEHILHQNKIICNGKISPGKLETTELSVHNPSLYFVSLLKEFLAKNNIKSGPATDIDSLVHFVIPPKNDTLLVHHSPLLAEIITKINKDSENLYAEMLLKTIAKEAQDIGSATAGIKTIYQFLNTAGIDTTNISIRDGSGLSRKNLISARTITELLIAMQKSQYKEDFMNSLAIAGIDGTLEYRFSNSSAQNKVLAKTGTLDHVKALSGYVSTNNGDTMIFSILSNHYVCSYRDINRAQEKICELLLNFY